MGTTVKETKKQFIEWLNSHEDRLSEDIFEEFENPKYERGTQKETEKFLGLLYDLQEKAFFAGFITKIVASSPPTPKGVGFGTRRKRKSHLPCRERQTLPTGEAGKA